MTQTTSFDLSIMAPVIEKYQGRDRAALMPMLHESQALYGWLPQEVQEEIGKTLRVPLADIHGVVEFYTMFYNEPTARTVVRVCEDLACYLAGADKIAAAVEAELDLAPGETRRDGGVTYELVPCLGMCDIAPAALNNERPAGEIQPTDVPTFLSGNHSTPDAIIRSTRLLELAGIGKVDPDSLKDYQRNGGYQTLARVINEEPGGLIDEIERSGILGRGGAMFPLGRKWRFARSADGRQKHIVVNADESEPGTFKDRCLIEGSPFSIIEAATIASYAAGAERGWIFVRGEYPHAFSLLSEAVRQARESGYLGKNILGKDGFNFDIEMRMGAGAYICGEETALFEAIEGKRGFPRIKPPFPVTKGLFNEPTIVNNVETLVTVLVALRFGIDEWLKLGTEDSPGTKLYCVSGHVAKPGLYELPFGATIAEIIELAGGIGEERSLQAVLMGGAAGVFVGPEKLDVPLTYEDARAHGIPIGSGVIMVFDDSADLRQALYQLGHFFAHESCGKCFPCQIGTQRQMEILQNVAKNGGGVNTDKQKLIDIGFAMTETSLCGLGQTAASAVLSALDRWPELLE